MKKFPGWGVLAFLLSLTSLAPADERLFTYSYEAEVLPQGGLEFEQWITNASGHASGVFSRWKTREELEYGLTDKLSASLYLNFESSYESLPGSAPASESSFDGVSTEWKYRLLNPDLDPLGLLLYFEPRYSGPELELEGKAVLQKNLGESWMAVLNLTLENEYGFTADAQALHGELTGSGGLACKVTPQFSVGLEGQNLRVWPDWSSEGSSTWSLGPVLHLEQPKWWATFTVLPQVFGQPASLPGDNRFLGDDDHAKVETRLVVGLNF
jgi:hypothetical protein